MNRLGVLLVSIGLGAAAASCGGGDANSAGQEATKREASAPATMPGGIKLRLPDDWEIVRAPVDDVIYPVHRLVAASFPVNPGKPGPSCAAGHILGQRPRDGVLVELFEYTRRPNLARFPRRTRPFALDRSSYARHECSGPSYNLFFRDHGRALQVWVISEPDRTDPVTRRETIKLLDSLRFAHRA